MKKILIEMPLVSQCSATKCAYNQNNNCRAKAITVGDGQEPGCDTFFTSKSHTRESTRIAGVGACKVSNCKFNTDFECTAGEISVAVSGTMVRCQTHVPRERAVA